MPATRRSPSAVRGLARRRPDLDGAIEDSDWEFIEAEAEKLHAKIEVFAGSVRDQVSGMGVELPTNCIGSRKRGLNRCLADAGLGELFRQLDYPDCTPFFTSPGGPPMTSGTDTPWGLFCAI
jgi:hypothetical protein